METIEELASAFLEEGYRDLNTIVCGIQSKDSVTIARAAQHLAMHSALIGAEPLLKAAQELFAAAQDPRALLITALPSVAQAFADVESEIRVAMDREVPLFI